MTDYSNNAVRKIRRVSPEQWQVSTAAVGGALDTPYGIACGPVGEGGSVLLYVGCHNSSNLVTFSSAGGAPTVFAGCGRPGHVDGRGAAAAFNRPNGVAMDADGAVYVTDSGNHCVRHVTPDGLVTTLQSAHGAPSSVIVCDVGVRAAVDRRERLHDLGRARRLGGPVAHVVQRDARVGRRREQVPLVDPLERERRHRLRVHAVQLDRGGHLDCAPAQL